MATRNSSFHVHASSTHLRWSRSLAPVLTMPSGAELSFDLPDGGGNQITRENVAAGTAISGFDISQTDPGAGPVFVEGAEPGDVLRVEFLELTPSVDFGWTAIFPGFGILSEEFDGLLAEREGEREKKGMVKIWDLDGARERGYLVFREKGGIRGEEEEIRIPYRPFLGLVGVAPEEEDETFPMIPPRDTGGNIDTRWITEGSTLFLPVKVPGALLSCGDGHAAQGDGEVCGTAVETRMHARIRVTVEKGKEKRWVRSPWVQTASVVRSGSSSSSDQSTAVVEDKGEHMCLGIDSDLREATKKAVGGIVDWLAAEKDLDRFEAYMLASVAANLRMCEVVDMPNYAIGCAIPLGIFVS